MCSLMLHKKQCKSARSSFWENGKAGISIKSKGTKRQNLITHEPWAWQKSVVGRAHELKRTDPIQQGNIDVTGVLQFPFILTAVN